MKLFRLQSNRFGYTTYAANEGEQFPITDNIEDAALFGEDNIELKAKVWSAQAGYEFEVIECEC